MSVRRGFAKRFCTTDKIMKILTEFKIRSLYFYCSHYDIYITNKILYITSRYIYKRQNNSYEIHMIVCHINSTSRGCYDKTQLATWQLLKLVRTNLSYRVLGAPTTALFF